MLRLPGWLVLLVFLPIQVYVFLQLVNAWGLWKALGAALLISILATRAARPPFLRTLLFPGFGHRWEERRHWFQGALVLLAGVTFVLPWGPQPWLAVAALASAIKAAVR